MKVVFLFIRQHIKKLGRKWLALPLLVLFPLFMMGLLAVGAVSVLSIDKTEPIHIGLVDEDESKETQMIAQLLSRTSQLGSAIQIQEMSHAEATSRIEGNQLSSYIVFPEGFTESLYEGHSVTLPLVGNPKQRTDSYVIKQLLDSVTRHIRAAQASILTMRQYTDTLPMTDKQQEQFLFQQFKSFVLYTFSRGQMIEEHQVINQATSSPVFYYALGGWFVVLTIWLLAFYSFFTDDMSRRMKERMRLYGVTERQQLLAKMTIVFVIVAVCAAAALWLMSVVLPLTLYSEDIWRITGLAGLYSLAYLGCLGVIELCCQAHKLRLLTQSVFTAIVLLLSGAVIPVLYYPDYIQGLLPWSFSTEAFHWLKAVVLQGRFYADFTSLLMMTGMVCALFGLVSVLKERVRL